MGRDRRRPSHAEGSQAWAGAVVPTSLQPGSETVLGWQVSPPAPLWRLVTCASTHTHAYIMGPCALAHAMHTHTGTRTSHSIRGDLCHLCHKTERPRLPAVVLQQIGTPCCLSRRGCRPPIQRQEAQLRQRLGREGPMLPGRSWDVDVRFSRHSPAPQQRHPHPRKALPTRSAGSVLSNRAQQPSKERARNVSLAKTPLG